MKLKKPPNKTFSDDFDSFLQALKDNECFAFSRFSDGEVMMMQGLEIRIASDHCKIRGNVHKISYSEDDFKHFDPNQHKLQQQKLIDAFVYRQENYFKGISCRCCIGNSDFKWQIDLLKKGYPDEGVENLTWSNLFINANYLRFLDEVIPVLKTKKIIYVVNKNADLESFMKKKFNLVKDFRIGPNCIIDDLDIINSIDKYIEEYRIKDHVFLFSASSLSNMAIHKLFSKHPQNTYMDIGSSLNPFMKGIGSRRNYMHQLKTQRKSYNPCIW